MRSWNKDKTKKKNYFKVTYSNNYLLFLQLEVHQLSFVCVPSSHTRLEAVTLTWWFVHKGSPLSGQCIHHSHLEEELVDTTSIRTCKKCNRTISSHFMWLKYACYHVYLSILVYLTVYMNQKKFETNHSLIWDIPRARLNGREDEREEKQKCQNTCLLDLMSKLEW